MEPGTCEVCGSEYLGHNRCERGNRCLRTFFAGSRHRLRQATAAQLEAAVLYTLPHISADRSRSRSAGRSPAPRSTSTAASSSSVVKELSPVVEEKVKTAEPVVPKGGSIALPASEEQVDMEWRRLARRPASREAAALRVPQYKTNPALERRWEPPQKT